MSQGGAAVSSLESQRKGGPGPAWRRGQGELLLPTVPLVASFVRTLGVEEEESKMFMLGNRRKWACSRESCSCCSLSRELLVFSLQVRILGEGFGRTLISSPGVFLIC